MTKWEDIFSPVMNLGREVRAGQATLGQAVVDVIENGGSLLGNCPTGTGKSFSTLVPMISAIVEAKQESKPFRCVVSTETITLQNQLFDKDLPFLATLYPPFVYRKLMGRANYLCLESASLSARGNAKVDSMVQTLKTRQSNLGDGERGDVDRVLNTELTPDEWKFLAGSSKFCSDNQCSAEKCYSTLARNRAMSADLVVVNHALLATDAEMKVSAGGGAFADGLLGQINVLAVDEGHQLEPVLVSQWTKELSDWELQEMSTSVTTGIDMARSVVSNQSIGYVVNDALDDLKAMLDNIKRFYGYILERSGEEWKGSSSALALKNLSGNVPPNIIASMTEYEEENPKRLMKAERALEQAIKYLGPAAEQAREDKSKNLRKINKGLRASKDLLETVKIISKALETKDGIVYQYGSFGAIVDGWERRNGERGMTLRLVPLDVSARAKFIWAGVRTNILLSATLTDLTDNSFRYARECVAFPEGVELNVESPFDFQKQQLFYVTPAQSDRFLDSQFDLQELISLVDAAKGRSLILFTSRRELDECAQALQLLRAKGVFQHHIYVQEKDSNKSKLVDNFRTHTDSILLGLKSMFTGIDIQGDSLSLVILCRFPLPRFSVECRQQISHWRSRGFSKWYERESLTVFQQAAGRLIRSSTDKGVVALLDYRAAKADERVFKTAKLGVDSLGSTVTRSVQDVSEFFSGV